MNSVHDMGGMQGFGPVLPESDEPLFHAAWERRALAVTLAAGATGAWNIDQSRFARETLPPAVYLTSSYYQIWLRALENLLAERAMVGADELAAGRLLRPAAPTPRMATQLSPPAVTAALAAGSPTVRPAAAAARFAVGQPVRARSLNPPGHTRLPRYVRGKLGIIERVHGAHIYADRHAQPGPPPFDQRPEWLYTVAFSAAQLWGPDAEAGCMVSVDAWEPYLDAA